MDTRADWDRGAVLIAALGGVILAVALNHHWTEVRTLNGSIGPLAALALDSIPAVALMYAGYRLDGADFGPAYSWKIFLWTLGGLVLAIGVIGISMGIRYQEGRTISEPTFTLLVSADIGAIAGLVAGYYEAEATAAARRAERTASGLSFVNGIIRHDLRNDLQVIDGNVGLIATELDAESQGVADRLATVEEKTTEATDRLAETETIARTLVGTADFEPVDLVGVVDDITASIEETFDVRVTTALPDSATVLANQGLRSVVDNLLENAVEHNDAADPEIEVTVEVDGDVVRLTVRDNGPGIPVEKRASLFDRGESDSVGGLQIVRTLVEKYEGSIRVADSDATGTTFVVELPAA